MAQRRKLPKEEFRQCKGTRRHQWFITDVLRAGEFGIPVWHMCELCTTVRVTLVTRHGQQISRRYIYPEQYKGTEFSSDEFRMQEIKEFRAAARRAQEKSRNT